MTLIVETGQALPDAEAYASTADADDYFQKRGISIWFNMTDTEKEQGLRRATDYMVQWYRSRWLGARKSVGQALDWPRFNVQVLADGEFNYGFNNFPSDRVPSEVKKACIELALRASIGELNEDRSQAVVRETVGPITTVYDQYSPPHKQFPAVDGILKPYLRSTGGCVVKLGRC